MISDIARAAEQFVVGATPLNAEVQNFSAAVWAFRGELANDLTDGSLVVVADEERCLGGR